MSLTDKSVRLQKKIANASFLDYVIFLRPPDGANQLHSALDYLYP